MEDFIIKKSPEFIYFLQHPEKKDHYLIIQTIESEMNDWYAQFHRSGKYEGKPYAIMPHNKVNMIEKIVVPDTSLFGLRYFICNELEEITYKEDERWPYAELGWYVIKGNLDTAKWLQQYLFHLHEKKNSIQKDKQAVQQISLF